MGWFSDLFSGKETTTASQPAWYTAAAQAATEAAKKASEIGYVPYQGADVAAFTAQQKEAMQGVQNRFSSFNNPGTPPPQVQFMPEQDFGGGLKGFSSHGGYQTEIAKLEATYPGIAAMLKQFQKSPYGAVGAPKSSVAGGPGSFSPPGPSTMPPVAPGTPPASTTSTGNNNLGFPNGNLRTWLQGFLQ